MTPLIEKLRHYKLRTIIKKILIRGITLFYPLINLFYLPIVRHYFLGKLRKLSPDMQVFLVTRMDLGHHILNLHYAKLWEQERGKVAVCILTPTFQREKKLAKLICPKAEIICFDNVISRLFSAIFFHVTLYTKTFMKIYGEFLTIKANALYLIDAHPDDRIEHFSSSYHQKFDPNILLLKEQPKPFIESYLKIQSEGYYRAPYWEDYFNLYETTSEKIKNSSLDKTYSFLLKKLNISRPFFILNINCKIYSNQSSNSPKRRRINNPLPYSALIDFLIIRGYDVVLQGREEQPKFSARPHFIDYAHSKLISLQNDLALFSHSEGVISSKSGTEIFALIFHLPLLTLNFTEPATSIPLASYRYYFKHPKLLKDNCTLSWREFLSHPSFFDHGLEENLDILYEELSEEELVNATDEFLNHTENNIPWSNLTPKQKEFKETLQPFHLDHYLKKGAPCNCYLEENEKRYAKN